MIDGEKNPLTASAAFGEFQSGIQDRCAGGPAPADATLLGLPSAATVISTGQSIWARRRTPQ
jgi:hypothetical protein